MYTARVILFDFGYPMNSETAKIIQNSLKNFLILAYYSGLSSRLFTFGVSVLNSNFAAVGSMDISSINTLFRELDTIISSVHQKVTAEKFKNLIKYSIEMVLNKSKVFSNRATQGKYFSCGQIPISIDVTIVTQKTALLLVSDTLTDVINEISENHLKDAFLKKNINIVQLVNDSDIEGSHKNVSSADWSSCLINFHDIDCLLKNWLLRSNCEYQQIKILLNENVDFTIKCDIEECVVNSYISPFNSEFGSWNEYPLQISKNGLQFDSSGEIYTLEVLNQIPVTELCESQIFGVTRRLHATSSELDWNELQVNLKLFKELCNELGRKKVGLLASLNLQSAKEKVTAYFFITADEDTLLLRNITPCELYLPKRLTSLKQTCENDPNATYVVQTSLSQIPFLEKFSPFEISSGIHNCLRNHISQTVNKSGFLGNIDPDLKSSKPTLPNKTYKRKTWGIKYQNSSKRCHLEDKIIDGSTENRNLDFPSKNHSVKKQKFEENTHPALLPPATQEKYRKLKTSYYQFPELSQSFNENLL